MFTWFTTAVNKRVSQDTKSLYSFLNKSVNLNLHLDLEVESAYRP